MIKIQSLRSTIIAQFLVILLPVILLSGYQILTEAQRTATVDRAFQQHRLILAASDRYAVFKNGVVDAVDTEQLSRQALAALVDSHNYLGQLGRESGSVEIIESAGKLNAIVAELSQDSGMPALLKTRDAINTTHERIVRAVKNYEEQMNAAIVRSTDDSKRKTTLVIWVSTLVLAMTVWFVFRMIRHLSQPLGLAVSVANRIADDQPVAESEFRMHSDVGNLLKSLSRMHLSLQRYRAEVEDSHNGLEDKIRQLAESQASLAEAQRLAKFGNWHWEVTSPTAYWSDELYRILGADPRTCTPVMQNFLMLVDASEREAVSIKFQSLRQTAGSSSGEHRVIGMDGVTRIVHSQCSSVEGTTGAVVRLFGTIQDITERKRAEDEIHRLALHDSLTGLPNRQFFRDQLDHALARARRSNERLAIMFLDLDRFKRINDTMGHAAGDALLKQFAERLQFCVRDADYVAREDSETSGAVARLAGDEFTITLVALNNAHDAAKVARRIVTEMTKPFTIDGRDLIVTTSIGIALYPDDGDQSDTLLKNADAAMYQAKELGKNTYQFFAKELNTATFEKLTMENELRHALNRDQMVLYYQPKIDMQTGRIVGAEALIRWQHPQWGLIAPDQFIPMAEEIGLIVPIGEWVLEEACRQLRQWNVGLSQEIAVAVNLASPSFRQPDLIMRVASTLQRFEVPPHLLQIEATESILMRDVGATMTTLKQLRDLGVRISIDDFGTGYSSLSYLRRFPIDQLKIDRSFVKDLAENGDDAAITLAIISLAHSLRLEVVAEGVETVSQARTLMEQGCRMMQGFLFSRPVPSEEFYNLLTRGSEYSAQITETMHKLPKLAAVA